MLKKFEMRITRYTSANANCIHKS